MAWAVKPKAQIFEGLGWYFRFPMPLGLESSRTINEHGKNVVRPVNKVLTIGDHMQAVVAYAPSPADGPSTCNRKMIRQAGQG